jgi:peroxiredoxin
MSILSLLSIVILWVIVLLLGFLVFGTLRALGILSWRLEQIEATTPKRLGRDGLKAGKKAPDFTLPCVNPDLVAPVVAQPRHVVARSPDRAIALTEGLHDGAVGDEWSGRETAPQQVVSLHDFDGRKVLLVFTQSGCSPCKKIVPELNRLAAVGRIANPSHPQVVVVNNNDLEATRRWSEDVGARFPVLAQTQFSISKKYEVFATPFAFLIDEKGVIAFKGIINNRQHIRYVLSGASTNESNGQAESENSRAERAETVMSHSISLPSKEVDHV